MVTRKAVNNINFVTAAANNNNELHSQLKISSLTNDEMTPDDSTRSIMSSNNNNNKVNSERSLLGRQQSNMNKNNKDISSNNNCINTTNRILDSIKKHRLILIVSIFIFSVITGAGIALYQILHQAHIQDLEDEAEDLATGTGSWFANELDLAILPLFTISVFATEIDIFDNLFEQIGPANQPGSLPTIIENTDSGKTIVRRNVTGICDDPTLVNRFEKIADTIKSNAKMDGVLHNIQLSPNGVICLLHPMNNTEDFTDGNFLDNTKAWGVDLLEDPFHAYIARNSIKQDQLGIVGPRPLLQCPECGLYFIARLPIPSTKHQMLVDGEYYNKWGFATALINWENLVQRSPFQEQFASRGYGYTLTRTDRIYNQVTDTYDEKIVILAQSENYGTLPYKYSKALQTTNNEWVMTIEYDNTNTWGEIIILIVFIIAATLISILFYVVLVQKQKHNDMKSINLAQEAKVDIERNMTAYFAHELRNPLSAIDSALKSIIPTNNNSNNNTLPTDIYELIISMQLCSTFMSSIMNNLLDVRKMEEGKMILKNNPLSIKTLIYDIQKMSLPAVRPNVQLNVKYNIIHSDWVEGDMHRIQQVLTNVVSNAIKYTTTGSITLIVDRLSNGTTRFQCQDTGPGIPRSEQGYLFSRFHSRGGAPGTGLGLSIAKQIVGLMGGEIWFESDPTIRPGTNCIVLLPLRPCEEPESDNADNNEIGILSNSSSSKELIVQPIQDPLKILLVDDLKMNRSMLKRRLQKAICPNCIVQEASTGEEAISICENMINNNNNVNYFDIMVVDQYMEEAGGVMLGTDAIIALRRNKVQSYIIGCSGNDLDDEFISAGADLVWKKPMPSNEEIIKQFRIALMSKKNKNNNNNNNKIIIEKRDDNDDDNEQNVKESPSLSTTNNTTSDTPADDNNIPVVAVLGSGDNNDDNDYEITV